MGSGLNARILIVESFGTNAKSLSGHMSNLGSPVFITTATDAISTMAQLQREPVDLIIIDTCLKGKTDGFELCRALRDSNNHRDIPIILLLSGYLSLERIKGISAGADLLLHRPVVKEELLKMVRLLLGARSEWSESQSRAIPEDQPVRRLHSVA